MDFGIVLIAWILLSVAVGLYAERNGRGLVGMFALSMIASPLLGFIVVFATRRPPAPSA